ncbi:hypothetical protein FG379_000763 [Cryptosporidium bovis]|uniref:uncharacterized protein n=1 Tax=Cryptosporidium bovis TaxID=310047 RepID=UPI00351A4E2F|nr:hypothetical protein FG379_000763 [Cryptosporidium bovis]
MSTGNNDDIYDFGVYFADNDCFGCQSSVNIDDEIFNFGDKDKSDEVMNEFYEDSDNLMLLEKMNKTNMNEDITNYSSDIASYLSFYSTYSSVFPINSSFNKCSSKPDDKDEQVKQKDKVYFKYKFDDLNKQLFDENFTNNTKDKSISDSGNAFDCEDNTTKSVCDGQINEDLMNEPRHYEDKYYEFILGENNIMNDSQDPELKEISFNLLNSSNNIDDEFLVNILNELKNTIDTNNVNQINVFDEMKVNDNNT